MTIDMENKSVKEIIKIVDKYLAKEEGKRDEDNAKDIIKNMIGLYRTTEIERLCVPRLIKRNKFYQIYRKMRAGSKVYQSIRVRKNEQEID